MANVIKIYYFKNSCDYEILYSAESHSKGTGHTKMSSSTTASSRSSSSFSVFILHLRQLKANRHLNKSVSLYTQELCLVRMIDETDSSFKWTTFEVVHPSDLGWDKTHYSRTNLCPLPCTYISPSADSIRYSPSAELPLSAFSQLQHWIALPSPQFCCQRSLKHDCPLKSPAGHGLCLQALQGRHTQHHQVPL